MKRPRLPARYGDWPAMKIACELHRRDLVAAYMIEHPAPPEPTKLERIMELRAKGLEWLDVAKTLGTSSYAIQKYVQRHRKPTPSTQRSQTALEGDI